MTKPPSSNFGKIVTLGLALVLILVIGVMAYLARELSRTHNARQQMAEENKQLQEDLAQVRSEMGSARGMPWQRSSSSAASTGDAVAETAEKNADPGAPAIPPNTLVLDGTTVTIPDDGGLVATMRFNPTTTTGPLNIFALVVRLPRDSTARIVGLQPAGDAAYTNTRHRVADNGLFAIYEGNPTGLTPLQFDLSVTEPVTATVRGTCGLEAFEMDIQPDMATVTKL